MTSYRIAAYDLNGQLRGKRIPASQVDKAMSGGVRMPYSALNVDIEGADIDGSPLVFDSGDKDGALHATERGAVPLPWLSGDAILLPATMHHDDGRDFDGDPRLALKRALKPFHDQGHEVIAACELEFYLLDPAGEMLPPINPRTGRRLATTDVLSLRELDGFDRFFDDITHGAQSMGIGELVFTTESGKGQFEVTMTHGPALKVADDVLLLKDLIKGTARNHGLSATFMAKPFAQDAGNGLHTHFSILDENGQNILQDDTRLRAAIAGCLHAIPATTLIFAPFENSYERFVEGAHAPTAANWGYDNRTVAIRVPAGPAKATRIEHRIAGGDVNPYLLFAAIFGAAHFGLDQNLTPPPETIGNAYTQKAELPGLHATLGAAVYGIKSAPMNTIFAADLLDNLQRCKAQESRIFQDLDNATAKARLIENV